MHHQVELRSRIGNAQQPRDALVALDHRDGLALAALHGRRQPPGEHPSPHHVAGVADADGDARKDGLQGGPRRIGQDDRPVEPMQGLRALPDVAQPAARRGQVVVEVGHVPQQARMVRRTEQGDLRLGVCESHGTKHRRRHHGVAERVRTADQDAPGRGRVGHGPEPTGRSPSARRRAPARSPRADLRSSSRATSSRRCRGRSPGRTRGWRRTGPSGRRADRW